jgi:uncharacterized membrane protein
MIWWHTIDSWMVTAGRDTAAFSAVGFIGGWAAPLFLFLAGVSVPFAASARMTRGATRQQASRALQVRGWEVFLLAHVFRLQSFLLNPHARWEGLLKPDILNILGLGLVLAAFLWTRADTRRGQIVWLLVPAVFIVLVLTPWSRLWWWPTLLHPRLEAYIRPVGGLGVFTLFPAVAYVLIGTFVGIRISRHTADDRRFHARLTLAGLAAALIGALQGYVPASWHAPAFDEAGVVLWRHGVMIAALGLSWFLLRTRPPGRSEPVLILGKTSLFVYWVHVELVYGVFSGPLHHTLSLPAAIAGFVGMVILMLGLASAWRRRPAGPLIPAYLRAGGPSLRVTRLW